ARPWVYTLPCHANLSRRPMVALVPPHARKIDAVEQHGQLRGTQEQTVLAHGRPLTIGRRQGEAPLLQPLVPDHVAVLVPVEKLDPVAAPRAKYEQVARQRVLAQMQLYQRRQRVETLAHVGRKCAQEHPAGQGQTQHDGSSNRRTSWRSNSASKPGRTRSRRRSATTISMAGGGTVPVSIASMTKAGVARSGEGNVVEDVGSGACFVASFLCRSRRSISRRQK